MYTDWNSCLDSGRNELLFENRNKLFGAYVIRRDYSKNILFALLLTMLVFCSIITVTFIRFSIHVPPAVKDILKGDVITISDVIIPPIETPIEKPTGPAHSAFTNELVNPVVVNRVPV